MIINRYLLFLPYIISAICLWILFDAIALNFFFSSKNKVRKQKKSIVETGSMFAFFILTFFIGINKVGQLFAGTVCAFYLSAAGALLIITGTTVNIIGRLTLKSNWGNQIRIYENHTLVTTGIYKHIRHPLYSSTILMIYGSSLLFTNILIFILNTAVFLPFMIYRARQEDAMLLETFGDSFLEYKSHAGMMIPKRRKKGKTK